MKLNETEQACLDRYVGLLRERLGEDIDGVFVFGSVARGERWPDAMGIRSDIDVLVRTTRAVAQDLQAELFDATYPLFLECGRQISPAFKQVCEPMPGTIDAEAVRIWP